MAWSNLATQHGGTTVAASAGSIVMPITTNAVPANSWIYVAAGCFTANASITFSGGSLTWATLANSAAASPSISLGRAWAPAGLALGTNITATFAGNRSDRFIAIVSYTGGFSNSVAGAGVTATAAVAGWTSAPVAANIGDLAVCAYYQTSSNVTSTPNANTTESMDMNASTDNPDGGATTNSWGIGCRVVTATGAQALGGTMSAAATWRSVGACASEGTAPAGVTPTLLLLGVG